MIKHHAFGVEPWAIRETQLDLSVLAQTESIFALSNGHIGMRGNLDEGEPHGIPGSYLNGFYELRPLPYAEPGYGYPEVGETIVNITNGKIVRLLVEDEPFDMRYGKVVRHERTLDLRAGVLRRQVEWISPSGQMVRVRSVRVVSLVERAIAAIFYEVEPVDSEARIVIQSELVANEPVPVFTDDPRAAAQLSAPLVSELYGHESMRAGLVHSTRTSQLRMAAAMDHEVEGPPNTETTIESRPDLARLSIVATVEPGQSLRMVKFIAYGWSSARSVPALRDQVEGALVAARHTGWTGLVDGQRAFLDGFWRRADIELEGDEELQQAVRFALFHVLQSACRAERRALPAKGLTGPGYDGHIFWDSAAYVAPLLTYTEPSAVGDFLRWRQSTLPAARERARQLSLRGAAFPWRTIDGRENSSYWPAGTAAVHVNAGIADAVRRYIAATDDRTFEREVGLELLVETARLWYSLGHFDASGRFSIDGVTGPDEYSAIADNNVYTNLMAGRNLRAASDAAKRLRRDAAGLGVTDTEVAGWQDAADRMAIPFDQRLQVHPQAERFTCHDDWNFAATKPEQYPLLLHFPYFDLYRKQVVKQADLVLALYACGDDFTAEEKARDFAYYEAITVRDSSLSASIQAVMAAEVGHVELAYDYFAEAALVDLHDLQNNTRDGVHMASLAGTWLVAMAGLGGMRDYSGSLSFCPRLPKALRRMALCLTFRGRLLRVEFDHQSVRYSLTEGDPVNILHDGDPVMLIRGASVTRGMPQVPSPPPVRQPEGRAPERRSSHQRAERTA